MQSSDQSPSIAIFVPKRIASKNRLTGQLVIGNVNNEPNKTLTLRKRIPKLLLPKSLRPAMYSLDGFVPRPSINRITSTEAPTTVKQEKFEDRRIARRERKLRQQKNRRVFDSQN